MKVGVNLVFTRHCRTASWVGMMNIEYRILNAEVCTLLRYSVFIIHHSSFKIHNSKFKTLPLCFSHCLMLALEPVGEEIVKVVIVFQHFQGNWEFSFDIHVVESRCLFKQFFKGG